MIESGTHTPGVSAESFGLPPNTALRYEQPDSRLTGYITDYHVLDSDVGPSGSAIEWMLPSWPAIRVILADNPIALTLGETIYDPMPEATLYGTTSKAMRVTSSGGVTIGAGITPLGWSRLFRGRADEYRDRIVPLDTMMSADITGELVSLLRTSDRALDVKDILDRFFLKHMGPPDRSEAEIRALMTLIVDDRTLDLSTAAARIGIDARRLRRLATHHFGFPPKTLLLRARFLRSFLKMLAVRDHADYSLIAATYHDASHFLRDANRFLGMTPRRFMAMKTPYLDAALRARAAVFGTATTALHNVDTERS
ncbi:AraC family transcriptional regulator [Sphingomonas sp. ERG5]|uniref:AraC family transcriptional regulator n=1 Tax=Sphingomonas sp. ERG5 TaxID=1381597 RepID=UPI00054C628B|nr:helix-turn-helix domain-containing protein [Sphingomonas sp. ERG5]